LNIEIPDDVTIVNSWEDILMYFATVNDDLLDYVFNLILETEKKTYLEKFQIENLLGVKQVLNMNS
jgi:hypothetical protein